MEKRYNLGILEALFRDHLIAGNKNKITIKCYLSDIRHFLRWIEWKNSSFFSSSESVIDAFIFLSQPELIHDYFTYLRENQLPEATIRRRWFPIQLFYAFCIDRSILSVNPAHNMRSQLFPVKQSQFKKIETSPSESNKFSTSHYYNSLNSDMKNAVSTIYSEIIAQS